MVAEVRVGTELEFPTQVEAEMANQHKEEAKRHPVAEGTPWQVATIEGAELTESSVPIATDAVAMAKHALAHPCGRQKHSHLRRGKKSRYPWWRRRHL